MTEISIALEHGIENLISILETGSENFENSGNDSYLDIFVIQNILKSQSMNGALIPIDNL